MSSLICDKAYVNGKWVTAGSGKTFQVADVMILKIFSSKNSAKKFAFLTQNKAK
jgi:hypothetical protein